MEYDSAQEDRDHQEIELDEVWEAERQKREKALTKAIVEEWSSHGRVVETPLIAHLRSALDDWLSKSPPEFENRQTKKREQQQAATRRALELWQHPERKN